MSWCNISTSSIEFIWFSSLFPKPVQLDKQLKEWNSWINQLICAVSQEHFWSKSSAKQKLVLLSCQNDYLLDKNMALKHEDRPMTQVQWTCFPTSPRSPHPAKEGAFSVIGKSRFPQSTPWLAGHHNGWKQTSCRICLTDASDQSSQQNKQLKLKLKENFHSLKKERSPSSPNCHRPAGAGASSYGINPTSPKLPRQTSLPHRLALPTIFLTHKTLTAILLQP